MDSSLAQRRRELLSTKVRQRSASMRRDGAEASVHRGGSEEGWSTYCREPCGATTGA